MESIPRMKLSFLSKDINVKTRKTSQNTDSDMQEILRSWWSLANHIGWTGQKSIMINRDTFFLALLFLPTSKNLLIEKPMVLWVPESCKYVSTNSGDFRAFSFSESVAGISCLVVSSLYDSSESVSTDSGDFGAFLNCVCTFFYHRLLWHLFFLLHLVTYQKIISSFSRFHFIYFIFHLFDSAVAFY